MGELNYTWTNTESLLIYLIAGLARTDKETAIVVFLTLNTTRARIDLVERLAKLPKTAPECRDEVLAVTSQMNQEFETPQQVQPLHLFVRAGQRPRDDPVNAYIR